MARRMKGPSDRERIALRDIADILIPDSFHVWGYTKETVTDGLLESISEVEIIPIKMRMIYNVLKRCYEG